MANLAKDGPAKEKSYRFAVRIVRTVRELQANEREFVLSRQLVRSGTSIGANVAEAGSAQSRKDFISKMAIASKEARETEYWLCLLRDSGLLGHDIAESLLSDCRELIRILTSIVKTSQSNGD